MSNSPNIRVEMGHYALRVYINDVVHVCIPRAQLGPFQAWRDGPHHYSIEFHLANGQRMLCEYDAPEKWKAILEGLSREVER